MGNRGDDPLGLDAADREIRINELREQMAELGMEEPKPSPECPPEVHEQFMRHIIEYETAPETSQSEELRKEGVRLPAPESMDDAALRVKLWEVIRALAERSCYLHHTNHLSDRELYTHLRSESLKEVMPDFKGGRSFQWHIDLIGSCSEEDLEIGLRYYDSEEERKRCAREYPKTFIPPHEEPPFDRDRNLPQAPSMVPLDEEFEGDEGEEELL